MSDSVYSILTEAAKSNPDGMVPPGFDIAGTVAVQGDTSREGTLPGEVEAVLVRMPMRFTHNAIVNIHIARILNRGVKAYKELIRVDENPEESHITEKLDGRLNRQLSRAKKILTAYEPITIVDSVMSQMVSLKTGFVLGKRKKKRILNEFKNDVLEFAWNILSNGETIEEVKMGIALIGEFGDHKSLEELIFLSTCEEFTFFGVKAINKLKTSREDFSNAISQIIRHTNGWGKIAAVLVLSDRIDHEPTRDLLLAEGTTNVIGRYMLAVECAIKGNLRMKLQRAVDTGERLSPEMVHGICEIFNGCFEAEKIKDADSFDEIPEIKRIVNCFYIICERYLAAESNEASDVYYKLKERFGA